MSETESLAETYRQRRERLAAGIRDGIAIIQSSGPAPDPLLYDKNLRYLTGLTSRKAVLVLAPRGIPIDRWQSLRGPEVGRGRRVNEVLFVEARSAREKLLDGEDRPSDEITRVTGVADVRPLSEMNEVLSRALMKEKTLWLNTPSNPGLEAPLPEEYGRVRRLQERYYWLRLENVAPLIHDLRWVKEPYEIECLRRAFAIHTEIYLKLMQALKPGANESLGQAIFEYEITNHGPEVTLGLDDYEASIIVAAGKNAAVGHYMANHDPIRDGDLVLIDAGVAYEGYCSDITTTFPANGRFSPRQKELYRIVLEAQKQAIAALRPGASARDADRAIYDAFAAHGLAQHGYGTAGHPVGLNIHDTVTDPDRPLEPGVVLVIEPWLSIPEEGIGIRIESGVVITADGVEVLPEPPKEIEEIEAFCQRG
jgi:Xaa-Pro aminopeptidase